MAPEDAGKRGVGGAVTGTSLQPPQVFNFQMMWACELWYVAHAGPGAATPQGHVIGFGTGKVPSDLERFVVKCPCGDPSGADFNLT